MSDEVTEFPQPTNPLPAESQDEARVARKARRSFAVVFGPFVRAMRTVMEAYWQARSEGVEREDAARGIEAVLRDVWPRPVSRYGPACLRCDDVGYEDLVCRVGHRCLRRKCQQAPNDWEHRYVDPCPCDKGDPFRPRYRSQDDAIGEVAKVAKPKRGWSRAGA